MERQMNGSLVTDLKNTLERKEIAEASANQSKLDVQQAWLEDNSAPATESSARVKVPRRQLAMHARHTQSQSAAKVIRSYHVPCPCLIQGMHTRVVFNVDDAEERHGGIPLESWWERVEGSYYMLTQETNSSVHCQSRPQRSIRATFRAAAKRMCILGHASCLEATR
eukprot:3286125-Amphidinium_carterae.1